MARQAALRVGRLDALTYPKLDNMTDLTSPTTQIPE
jgi:hypothetical protein